MLNITKEGNYSVDKYRDLMEKFKGGIKKGETIDGNDLNKNSNELKGNELNKYIYVLQRYIDYIRENDPVRGQLLNTLLTRKFKNNDEVNFFRKSVMMQEEILSLYYNGDYKIIDRDFYCYLDNINNIFIEEKNDETENIIKLNLVTFLLINLSLCAFDNEKIEKIEKFGKELLKELEKKGLDRYIVIVKNYLYKLSLQKDPNSKFDIKYIENLIDKLKKDRKKIEEEEIPNIEELNITNKDIYQYLVLKLESQINNYNFNEKEDEKIKETINEIKKIIKKEKENTKDEKKAEEELDLKIHFKYLEALYYKIKGYPTKSLIKNISNKIGRIINLKNEKEPEDKEEYLNKSKTIISEILENKEIKDIENKIFFIDSLILLIELEEDITKKEENFFKAWGYMEKHFGDLDNFYKQKLLKLGKILFPEDNEKTIKLKYELNNFYKEREESNRKIEKIEGEEGFERDYEHLSELLKEVYQVEDLFIYDNIDKNIKFSNGFQDNNNNNLEQLFINDKITEQLDEKEWKEIKVYNKTIEGVINTSFFSETLVGKIITIGPKKLTVFLSRGRKNKTKFNKEELKKIELLYLGQYLSVEMLNEYSLKDAENQKKLEKLYKEQKKAYEKIEELMKQKEIFVKRLSHDINNPLTVSVGVTELIKMNLDDILDMFNVEENKINNIEFSKDDVDKIKTIISEILDNIDSMIKANQRIIKLNRNVSEMFKEEKNVNIIEKININNEIQDIIKSQEVIIKNKNKNIKINVFNNTTENTFINIDKSEFHRIFENIIGNAIKYINLDNGKEGKINININLDGDNLIIKISDNGPGIEEKNLEKIFEHEVQVGDNTTDKDNNLGLNQGVGLGTVKEIVEKYKGQIIAQNNNGATFIITLPIKQN